MRLKDDKSLLLFTASSGDYTLDGIKKAALVTFPSAHVIRPPQSYRFSRQYRRPGRKPRADQRSGGNELPRDKSHCAHECQIEPKGVTMGSSGDMSCANEGHLHSVVRGPPGLTAPPDDELMPKELRMSGSEATVFLTQAAGQSFDAGKARCFYQEGNHHDSNDKREHFKKLKARFPYVKCGVLGH